MATPARNMAKTQNLAMQRIVRTPCASARPSCPARAPGTACTAPSWLPRSALTLRPRSGPRGKKRCADFFHQNLCSKPGMQPREIVSRCAACLHLPKERTNADTTFSPSHFSSWLYTTMPASEARASLLMYVSVVPTPRLCFVFRRCSRSVCPVYGSGAHFVLLCFSCFSLVFIQ